MTETFLTHIRRLIDLYEFQAKGYEDSPIVEMTRTAMGMTYEQMGEADRDRAKRISAILGEAVGDVTNRGGHE